MVSATLRQRSITVKAANPSADKSAAMLPAKAPVSSPSRTMTKMPATPTSMAAHVSGRTRSPSNSRPRRAARKGLAVNRNTALAMVVDWMA